MGWGDIYLDTWWGNEGRYQKYIDEKVLPSPPAPPGYDPQALAYYYRITPDGGRISGNEATNELFQTLPQQESIQFAWAGVAGSKQRESGVWGYYSKLYTMWDAAGTNDATQTTESLQPYVGSNIAPNENEGMKNVDGDGRYITHPQISFEANEAWSVNVMARLDGNYSSLNYLFGSLVNGSSRFFIYDSSGNINYQSNDGINNSFSGAYTGKQGVNTLITLTHNGNGSLSLYLDGVLIEATPEITDLGSFVFEVILNEYAIHTRGWGGTVSTYIIHSLELTPTEIGTMHSDLSNLYPEIPSVTIGTQEWATSNFEAVATPMGTVIPEVQDDATWATSQTLYDDYLAANPGDTYGATKAAAMWCYYNNDIATGAIYGKLYNWFAVSLLQQDIDLYNQANPTAKWGWHVPTEAEFTTLQTELGGSSIAGGKMKMTGLDYWNSPNTGATNESGFTALGGDVRSVSGDFSLLKEVAYFIGLSSGSYTNPHIRIFSAAASMSISNRDNGSGLSLRLIKDN